MTAANDLRTDLKSLLTTEYSLAQVRHIAHICMQRHEFLPVLLDLQSSGQEPLDRRASWVMDKIIDDQAEILDNYADQLIKNLLSARHDAIKRSVLRYYLKRGVPEYQQGRVYSNCIFWVGSEAEAIAVRAFSMRLCYEISCKHPDLKPELLMLLEDEELLTSAGLKNVAYKLRRRLRKELNPKG